MKNFLNKSIKSENVVLDYIRRNVTLERIKRVERILLEWAPFANLLNLDEYFDLILMESIYRAHKGSFKIDASKIRGMAYLELILYILFGEPEFDPHFVIGKENIIKLKKALKKHFEKDSYFLRYSLNYLAIKTGDLNKKTGWINIEPYVYPLLGGEIFYYCTLRALIEISKKALTDEKYDYIPIMNWKEGIVHYLVYEIIEEPIFEENIRKSKKEKRTKNR